MFFKIMVYAALLTPLLGIYQVENGAYAWSIGRDGHANGATLAFAIYLVVVFVGITLSSGTKFFRSGSVGIRSEFIVEMQSVNRIALVIISANILFLVMLMFGFGGYKVLLGEVSKGEYRTSLGQFGAVAYIITKWIAPALFAYLCAIYSRVPLARKKMTGLLVVALLMVISGMTWGFKTTSIAMIMPGLIILTWNAGLYSLIKYLIAFVAFTLISFYIFDSTEKIIVADALQLLWARATIIQGDVSWYLWSQWTESGLNYNYWKTLPVFIGDKLWTLFTGVGRENMYEWILSHYGLLLTYAVGYPPLGIMDGHSVTGTPFSEGLIAGGVIGMIGFGLLAGVIVGFTYVRIVTHLSNNREVWASLWSVYFVFAVFPWINAGEIVQLFHISVGVSLVLCWFILCVLNSCKVVRRESSVQESYRKCF